MTQPIHYHYHPEECRGVSIFEFIHAEDISFVRDGLKWSEFLIFYFGWRF